jgi:hypothetical protein
MAKRAERSAAKEQYWREVIDGWRRSGGSVRQWCTLRQVSEPSFYSWRRTLAERDAAAALMPPVRRRVRRKRGPAAMIPVEIVPPSNQPQSAPLEIILRGGVQVLVRADCQPALLREALAALRSEREESASC